MNPILDTVNKKIKEDFAYASDFIRSLHREVSTPPPLLALSLHVIKTCNLSCRYCFEKQTDEGKMDIETACRIVDEAMKKIRPNQKAFSIVFFGGEPLLNWDVVKGVIDHCGTIPLSFSFSLTTNLTVFNDEMLYYLRTRNLNFLVSFDGAKETHDKNRCNTYDIVSANLRKIIDAGLKRKIYCRMTVMPDTVSSLYDDVRHIYGIGVDGIAFLPCYDKQWTKKSIDTYVDQLKKLSEFYLQELQFKDRNISFKIIDDFFVSSFSDFSSFSDICTIGTGTWASFDSEGNEEICHRLHYFDKEIDRESLLLKNRLGKLPKEECKSCKAISICNRGCPIENFEYSHSCIEPTKSFCKIMRSVFPVAKEIAEKVAKIETNSRIISVFQKNRFLKEYFDTNILFSDKGIDDIKLSIVAFEEMLLANNGIILQSFYKYFFFHLAHITAMVKMINRRETNDAK